MSLHMIAMLSIPNLLKIPSEIYECFMFSSITFQDHINFNNKECISTFIYGQDCKQNYVWSFYLFPLKENEFNEFKCHSELNHPKIPSWYYKIIERLSKTWENAYVIVYLNMNQY